MLRYNLFIYAEECGFVHNSKAGSLHLLSVDLYLSVWTDSELIHIGWQLHPPPSESLSFLVGYVLKHI